MANSFHYTHPHTLTHPHPHPSHPHPHPSHPHPHPSHPHLTHTLSDYDSWSHPMSIIFDIGYYLNFISVIQQFLKRIFGISFETSLETLPSDDSFSRDGIAIMVAGLTLTLNPQPPTCQYKRVAKTVISRKLVFLVTKNRGTFFVFSSNCKVSWIMGSYDTLQ